MCGSERLHHNSQLTCILRWEDAGVLQASCWTVRDKQCCRWTRCQSSECLHVDTPLAPAWKCAGWNKSEAFRSHNWYRTAQSCSQRNPQNQKCPVHRSSMPVNDKWHWFFTQVSKKVNFISVKRSSIILINKTNIQRDFYSTSYKAWMKSHPNIQRQKPNDSIKMRVPI